MSDDLVTFLRARLDEDEELAKQADECGAPRWDSSADPLLRYGLATRRRLAEQGVDGALDGAVAAHHARHNPARVLAEVEAKRQIIGSYAAVLKGRQDIRAKMRTVIDTDQDQFGQLHIRESGMIDQLNIMEPSIRALALPHADHADYREEWRP